ncbi:O-antigen translocase [Legionella bozemanae]|uniref:O-antigen translocase n=1 Tax=Legionella bozemanae TaxID=447 RepID=UPI003EEA9A56
MKGKLVQTSILSGTSTLIKVLIGVLSLKIVALYTGPKGVGVLGQFMAIANVISVVAGGGVTLGVIKYVAEYTNLPEKFYSFLSTAFCYTLFCSCLVIGLTLLFSTSLAHMFLGATDYLYLLQWLLIAQAFTAIYLFITSIINGLGKIKLLVCVNVLSSIVSLILIAFFTNYYQLKGALGAFVLSQGITFLIAYGFVYREQWFRSLFSFRIEKAQLVKLLHYSLMTIVSTLTVPLSQVFVRNDIHTLYGWDAVGMWQSVLRLSDAYLLFVTTILTTYYLPKLSQLEDNTSLKEEMRRVQKILFSLIALMLFVIYISRKIILLIFYDDTFIAAENLFLYQLIGDFFKIAGWTYTYLLLAKSKTKEYIVGECIIGLIFILLGHIFLRQFGLVGVTYAFALTYFIYWLFMMSISLFYFKGREKSWVIMQNS